MADLSQVAVIFDLDGTLIDSAPDIHATANRVMAEMGLPALSLAQVQSFVGKGLPHLVAQLLHHHGQEADNALVAHVIARFEAEYLVAHGLTTAYPGAIAALQSLQNQGAALGICTNKPLAPARAVLRHLGLATFFPVVIGGDSLPLRKPDPAPLHAAANALCRPKPVFVGDSEVDAETAQAARMPLLLFTEGYRKSPPDQIPHHAAFADWAALPDLVAALG